MDHEKAKKIAERMRKGAFDMNDLADQLRQLEKMGGMGNVMKMMPGMGKISKQLEGVDLDKQIFKRQVAIIGSMTKKERTNPKVIDGKRRKRIAAGSGTKVEEVNKLLKMHVQMADMMKQMGSGKGMLGKLMGGKGMPDQAEMEKMQKELAAMDPNSLPPELRDLVNSQPGGGAGPSGKMPDMAELMKGMPGGGMPKLPGLGGLGGLPGLGNPFKNLPGFGKKK
jgi:signal recognition particle subunit SRP54